MMSGSKFTFRIAQAIGFTGAAWLSGNIAALSANAVPGVVTSARGNIISPKVACTQWRNMYEAGKTQNPPIAAATASAFTYVAWSVRQNPTLFVSAAYSGFGMYTVAAVLTLSIVPYTIVAMKNTNNALLELADSKGDLLTSRAEVEGLLDRWITLNWIRSLLPLAGGLAGIAAALL